MLESFKIIRWHLKSMIPIAEERLNRALLDSKRNSGLKRRVAKALWSIGVFKRFMCIMRVLTAWFGNMCAWRLLEYPIALAFLEKATSKVKDVKVLDIGSGDTCFPSYLANKGYKVSTIDIDAKAIFNQEKIRKERLNVRYDILRMDACELGFSSNSFDAVFAISSLEHIPNDIPAIKEIHRILKKDGILILSLPFSRKYRCPQFIKGNFFQRFHTDADIEKKYNGFSIVRRRYIGKALFTRTFYGPLPYGKFIIRDLIIGICIHMIEKIVWGTNSPRGVGDRPVVCLLLKREQKRFINKDKVHL